MSAAAVVLDGVSKQFTLYHQRGQGLKERVLALFGRGRATTERFWALDDVSFTIEPGQTLGLIGRNGCGKSTLLQLLAGILEPDRGRVQVRGRVTSLLELGAGFSPDLTGRENVFLNASLHGVPTSVVAQRFDDIVAFAELERFIDSPVRNYSSGMYMRLGFAVAVHVDPDVLLVDEVLAVGDEGFAHKCLDKFGEFRRRGKTIVLVTHSLGLVERFCDEALWLHEGRVRAAGDPKRVVDAYVTEVEESEEAHLAAQDARARELAEERRAIAVNAGAGADASVPEGVTDEQAAPGSDVPANMFQVAEGRWGSREIEILDVALVGPDGRAGHVFHSGDAVSVRLKVVAPEPVNDFVFGIGLFNTDGLCIYGTNTNIEEMVAEEIVGEAEVRFDFEELSLTEGTYKLDVAVHKLDGYPYDYHRQLYTFRVKSRIKDVGFFRPRHRWQFSGNVSLRKLEGPEGWRQHM